MIACFRRLMPRRVRGSTLSPSAMPSPLHRRRGAYGEREEPVDKAPKCSPESIGLGKRGRILRAYRHLQRDVCLPKPKKNPVGEAKGADDVGRHAGRRRRRRRRADEPERREHAKPCERAGERADERPDDERQEERAAEPECRERHERHLKDAKGSVNDDNDGIAKGLFDEDLPPADDRTRWKRRRSGGRKQKAPAPAMKKAMHGNDLPSAKAAPLAAKYCKMLEAMKEAKATKEDTVRRAAPASSSAPSARDSDTVRFARRSRPPIRRRQFRARRTVFRIQFNFVLPLKLGREISRS